MFLLHGRLAPELYTGYNRRVVRVLVGTGLMIITVFVAASCAGSDDGQQAATDLPDNTFGIIDGFEDGVIRFPVIELWDIPACSCDQLITNTPHGTRIRVLSQKKSCPGAPYKVEIAEGDKAGIQGWVLARHVTLDDATESPLAD